MIVLKMLAICWEDFETFDLFREVQSDVLAVGITPHLAIDYCRDMAKIMVTYEREVINLHGDRHRSNPRAKNTDRY
ncbi:hypothetical protein A6I77_23275 [Achromobacter xylosoxidans]|nr:hypothetical protein A6I77_23275 [Achromobacter xylosoxidans]